MIRRQGMGYKRFIPLFAFGVFCIAAYLLYRALSAYERAKIVEAIFAIPRPRLALGTLFVGASYFSLTLFRLALLLQAHVATKLLGFSRAGAIALGAACLVLTALYVVLAAVLPRPLAIRRWEIPMPPVKLALAQVSIGTMTSVSSLRPCTSCFPRP